MYFNFIGILDPIAITNILYVLINSYTIEQSNSKIIRSKRENSSTTLTEIGNDKTTVLNKVTRPELKTNENIYKFQFR